MLDLCLHAGSVVQCRRVIVTVPIMMLQQERIIFSPPLPAEKTAAISRIKMSNAVKVRLLVFSVPSLIEAGQRLTESQCLR